jgi:hypothetical protein
MGHEQRSGITIPDDPGDPSSLPHIFSVAAGLRKNRWPRTQIDEALAEQTVL